MGTGNYDLINFLLKSVILPNSVPESIPWFTHTHLHLCTKQILLEMCRFLEDNQHGCGDSMHEGSNPKSQSSLGPWSCEVTLHCAQGQQPTNRFKHRSQIKDLNQTYKTLFFIRMNITFTVNSFLLFNCHDKFWILDSSLYFVQNNFLKYSIYQLLVQKC